MRTAFKILISYFLTVAVLFSLVSCEWNLAGETDSNDDTDITDTMPDITEVQNVTTETTPNEAASEKTTTSHFDEIPPAQSTPGETVTTNDVLEQTTPQETEPGRTTAWEEVTSPEQTITSEVITTFEEITTSKETTDPEEITTPEEITSPEVTTSFAETETTYPQNTTFPEETTTPELPHEHKIVNGQCVCGYVLVVENVSQYDNDGDGEKDVFYFSSVLPERFTAKGVIHFEAGEYMPSSRWVGTPYEAGDNYYFCRNDRKSYIMYEIEVAEAGIYELAIYQRMKDIGLRGAKFTVNEDSDEKYAIATSYQFDTEQALIEVCEGRTALASYMFGIRLELVEGVNSIKIELGPGIADGQYFREFYLIKMSE